MTNELDELNNIINEVEEEQNPTPSGDGLEREEEREDNDNHLRLSLYTAEKEEKFYAVEKSSDIEKTFETLKETMGKFGFNCFYVNNDNIKYAHFSPLGLVTSPFTITIQSVASYNELQGRMKTLKKEQLEKLNKVQSMLKDKNQLESMVRTDGVTGEKTVLGRFNNVDNKEESRAERLTLKSFLEVTHECHRTVASTAKTHLSFGGVVGQ